MLVIIVIIYCCLLLCISKFIKEFEFDIELFFYIIGEAIFLFRFVYHKLYFFFYFNIFFFLIYFVLFLLYKNFPKISKQNNIYFQVFKLSRRNFITISLGKLNYHLKSNILHKLKNTIITINLTALPFEIEVA